MHPILWWGLGLALWILVCLVAVAFMMGVEKQARAERKQQAEALANKEKEDAARRGNEDIDR